MEKSKEQLAVEIHDAHCELRILAMELEIEVSWDDNTPIDYVLDKYIRPAVIYRLQRATLPR